MADAERTPLFAEGGASTLALVGYITLAVVLMVADSRGGYLDQVRAGVLDLFAPVYRVAEWPSKAGEAVAWHWTDRNELQARQEALHRELLQARSELAQLRDSDREAARVRALVDFIVRERQPGQVARLINVDLDTYAHRILLDKGSADGVGPGTVVFDGRGIAGQVVEAGRHTCAVMLISHPEHAVPVEIERSGVRAIAYGTGQYDQLALLELPLTADVREGDRVQTSGLGGRFPSGYPLGEVTALEREPGAAFARATVAPYARLIQAREVLLLPPVVFEGPSTQPDLASPPGS